MNTSMPFIGLLGTLAMSPVLAGELTASRPADAQSQAAQLLRAEVAATSTRQSLTDRRRADKDALHASAQTQAARLLRAESFFAPAADRPAAADAHHRQLEARLMPDAQAQAQGILRAERPRSEKTVLQVVAASR